MKFRLMADLELDAENLNDAMIKLATFFSRKGNGHHVDNFGKGNLEVNEVVGEGMVGE